MAQHGLCALRGSAWAPNLHLQPHPSRRQSPHSENKWHRATHLRTIIGDEASYPGTLYTSTLTSLPPTHTPRPPMPPSPSFPPLVAQPLTVLQSQSVSASSLCSILLVAPHSSDLCSKSGCQTCSGLPSYCISVLRHPCHGYFIHVLFITLSPEGTFSMRAGPSTFYSLIVPAPRRRASIPKALSKYLMNK